MNKGNQILECRDDQVPVILSAASEGTGHEQLFKLSSGAKCSWLKEDETVGPSKLRPRIEPWLTALLQSEHLSLLVGSGLSHALHRIATGKGLSGMNPAKFSQFDAEISSEAKKSAKAAGREEGNIEDQIRVANELYRGLEIIASSDEKIQGKARRRITIREAGEGAKPAVSGDA